MDLRGAAGRELRGWDMSNSWRKNRPRRVQSQRTLRNLDALQVADQVTNTELRILMVGLVHLSKDRTPGGHRTDATSGGTSPIKDHRDDPGIGITALMTLTEPGQIGGRSLQ